MLETGVTILAWMGVFLIQALLHYKLRNGARKHSLTEESCTVKLSEVSSDKVKQQITAEDEERSESLDGDEPLLFFELLSQTGSEMMHVRLELLRNM